MTKDGGAPAPRVSDRTRGSRRPLGLALLSGILLSLAFPPLEWSWAAFVGLAPLILAVKGASRRRAFFLGWLSGFVFFSLVVWWITVAVINYGYLPVPVGWGVLFLLTAILGVYPGFFALAVRWAGERDLAYGVAGVLIPAAAWTLLEWVRGNLGFAAFPWANLAYSQYRSLPFIQTASLAGPYGPGFVIAAVNAALAGLIVAVLRRETRLRAWPSVLLVSLLVAGSLLFGYARLRAPEPGGKPLRVAVLQGNISQDVKWDKAFREATLINYEDLTRTAAAGGAELIVWPEAAAPVYFQEEAAWQERVFALAREAKSPLLLGSPAFTVAGGNVRMRNRVWYVAAGGSLAGFYDKMHLVPFGEYVPLRRLLFFAKKLVQEVGDFTPGDGFRLFEVGGERFGTVICYEIIFPDLVRRAVREGATFMTTVTNDAWYGPTSASLQHFSQMVFRAVENDLPLARAANTGISGFVDARGRILVQTPLFERGAWLADLVPSRGRTFYTRRGDLFVFVLMAALACLGGVFALRSRRGAHHPRQGEST
jgi:apolipoprotein N-acyltransferase